MLTLISCCSSYIRMEIITYLKRPDLKQELLTTWQSNYNSIPDNLRNEAIMIAEQHQCVDVSSLFAVDKYACVLCALGSGNISICYYDCNIRICNIMQKHFTYLYITCTILKQPHIAEHYHSIKSIN